MDKVQPPEQFTGQWYVIRTKPGQEEQAKINLQRQHFRVYLPRLSHKVKSRGRWQIRSAAWFPGYLFIGPLTPEQSLVPVRSTYGVAHIVRFGNIPATVPAAVLTAIHALELQRQRAAAPAMFAPGDKVCFDSGPLCGHQAIVSHNASDRVDVLLTMLGRQLQVHATTDMLHSVS